MKFRTKKGRFTFLAVVTWAVHAIKFVWPLERGPNDLASQTMGILIQSKAVKLDATK